MKITVTGKDFHKEFLWHKRLVYNDTEHELSITQGDEIYRFCNIRLKGLGWNTVVLTGLTPLGSGSGLAPEERTITIQLLA